MTVSGFDTQLDQFQQWRQSPLEQLRHTLTEANLLRHVSGPRQILDVAGGNGLAAVRLATRGHEVTVLDPAGAMLRTAIELAELHGVADRLHVVQAGAQDAHEVLGEHQFDVVLCHNLLHYADGVDERREVLAAITAPLRDGGLLSVLGPNDDFTPVQTTVRELAPSVALAELAGAEPEWPAATRCTPAEVIGLLVELGVEEVVRYGVRCLSDLVPDEHAEDPAFLADLERLELALSDRMPHLLTARYYHLVARL